MTAKPKKATRKAAPKNAFADGPPPGQGGAWIRGKDGKLERDGDTEQAIPDADETAPEQPSEPDTPPPPPGPDTAGVTTNDSQEG